MATHILLLEMLSEASELEKSVRSRNDMACQWKDAALISLWDGWGREVHAGGGGGRTCCIAAERRIKEGEGGV